MHKVKVLAKILFRKHGTGYLSWNILLPIFGVSIGVFAISIIFATMKGLENDIYNRLKAGKFNSRIFIPSKIKPENVYNVLDSLSVDYFKGSYKSIGVGSEHQIYDIWVNSCYKL